MPDLLGMELEVGRKLIPDYIHVIIKMTESPFDMKKIERVNCPAIIIRQKYNGDEVELLVSSFKAMP